MIPRTLGSKKTEAILLILSGGNEMMKNKKEAKVITSTKLHTIRSGYEVV